jgi:hypothetical protein
VEIVRYECLDEITPHKPIITIPMSLYRGGNGDDAKEGGAEPYSDE